MKRSVCFIGLVCLFMLAGCVFGQGNLKVVVTVPDQLQPQLTSVFDFSSMKVIVTQGQKVVQKTQSVSPSQQQFEVSVPSLRVGACQVDVLITDSEGRTVYTGKGNATIEQGKETVANITVGPAGGTVTVEVDIPAEMTVDGGTVTMTHYLTQITDPKEVSAELTIAGSKATATFTSLYATTWGIAVTLQNANTTVGEGNSTVAVLPNQHLTVNVPVAAPEHGTLEGNVFLAQQTNHAGITVTVGDSSTTTDSFGHYRIEQVPVGSYVVTAEKDGYFSNNCIVEIKKDQTTTADDLILYPLESYGSVSGYAKYLNGSNHEGIAIKIQTLEGQPLPDLIAVTDANGYFEFPYVPVDPITNKAKYIFTAFAINYTLPYSTDSQEIEVVGNVMTSIQNDFILRMAGVELMIFADDETPWDSSALAEMLAILEVKYQIYTSADMATVSLPLDKIVWIINDQPQEFYNQFAANQNKFHEFVFNGGTMLFEACDEGWNSGSLSEAGGTLPGGVISNLAYYGTNIVVNPTHPMMKGVPETLIGTYASHNYFTNIPAGHTVLTASEDGNPTLVEYRYGSGRVVATGQPLEYSWRVDQNPETIYPNLIYYTFNLPIPDPEPVPVAKSLNPKRYSGKHE